MTWDGTESVASQSVEGRLGNRRTSRMPTGKGSVESGRPGTGSDRSGTGNRRSGTYGEIPAAAAVATTECAAVKGPTLVNTRMGSCFATGGGGAGAAAAATAHSRRSLGLGFGVSGSEVCVAMGYGDPG
jgi:hypothetical protein